MSALAVPQAVQQQLDEQEARIEAHEAVAAGLRLEIADMEAALLAADAGRRKDATAAAAAAANAAAANAAAAAARCGGGAEDAATAPLDVINGAAAAPAAPLLGHPTPRILLLRRLPRRLRR